MKQILTPAHATFDFTAKTITFATTIPASVGHILQVTNVTRGVLYFQPQGGLTLSGSYVSPVLTLLCSTAGHADADELLILYDDGLGMASQATLESVLTKVTTPTYSDQYGFQIPAFDYKEFAYTGTDIDTIIYKTGGSGGTLVATLTFAYSGTNIASITKT